jgi:hypothetical protein
MKKILIIVLLLLLGGSFFWAATPAKAEEHGVTFTANVLTSLILDITPGDSFDFGDLTFDTPVAKPTTGTVVSVETNAANGYTLGVSDDQAGNDSGLENVADPATHVPDMTNGTITTPVLWGTNSGLGVTLFAADTNKEAKWGTGTTYNDANNKYAAIPQNATTAHTVTGFHGTADTSSWAYMVETGATQKSGAYSGEMTFTATAVLS